ncbi:3'-5' exonuclease [Bacteroidales bacterium OttesenSCG-928-C19]|nr:3'-5' exonuclease [Bacteroidales bacterium OttesenSCG-928-C19]
MTILENILFLDIETVPLLPSFDDLSEEKKALWEKKCKLLSRYQPEEESKAEELYERAGIYAEFGKIICISVGYFSKDQLRVKSFYDDDEKVLLTEFARLVQQHFSRPQHRLCAHNGKEFDYPYIARRMLINGIKLPPILNITGKKPWENPHLDTLEMWKFGDYKHYTSLELLASVFDIPTPKDDIDGSQVCEIYWKENDLKRIVNYCQKDVITVVRLFQKMNILSMVEDEQILIIE